jgi:hypothetical protein
VFGDGGGQVVIGDLARDATQRRKGVHVTTDEGFKALAVSELQIQHAAVGFDQRESIELALVPGVIEHAEVPPIDLEALAGRRLHPQEGAAGLQLRTNGLHIPAQNAVPTAVAQRPQLLFHHGGRNGGILELIRRWWL